MNDIIPIIRAIEISKTRFIISFFKMFNLKKKGLVFNQSFVLTYAFIILYLITLVVPSLCPIYNGPEYPPFSIIFVKSVPAGIVT